MRFKLYSLNILLLMKLLLVLNNLHLLNFKHFTLFSTKNCGVTYYAKYIHFQLKM